MKDLWNPIRVSLCVAVLILAGCGDDNGNGPGDEPDPYNTILVNLFDTQPLETGYIFQLWAAGREGTPKITGTAAWTGLAQFSVIPGATGQADTLVSPSGIRIAENVFSGLSVDLDEYDSLYVTIEEDNGMATTPSATVYLQTDIPDDFNVVSSVDFSFPIDLASRTAIVQVLTPTDGDSENDTSGVWFMRFVPYQPGLTLPDAPAGWRYEGWVYREATRLSTGRFTSPEGNDEFNGYSSQNLPGFPGEDFLVNAPQGVTFPWVFVGGDEITISLEPHPDTDPGPFPIELFNMVLVDPVSPNIATPMDITENTIPNGKGFIERGPAN